MNQSNRRSGPSAHRSSRLLAGVIAAIAVVGGMLVSPPAAEAADELFVTPVSGRVSDIVNGCPAGSRPTHQGVDINMNSNASVYAASAGTVTTAVNSNATTGYGSQVVITHPGGLTTRYGHLVFGSVTLKVGASVPQGALLGRVGSTGNSTGPHLHFEMYNNGVNLTNAYFACGQGNVAALTPLKLRPERPVNADVNRDGNPDILAVSTAGRMTVYNGNGYGSGNGAWRAAVLGGGWETTRALIHGDYNGDGRGDFMAVRTDGALWFYRGNGANGFVSSRIGGGWDSIRLLAGGADFNNDGRADLVVVRADGALLVYPGNGAGGFTSAILVEQGWGDKDMIVAGDFGRDGIGDVMARDTSGKLFLYSGSGAGFAAPVQVGNGWSGMSILSGGVDYTGDGFADLIARDAAGVLWIYPWNGSAFTARVKIGNGWNGHRLIH